MKAGHVIARIVYDAALQMRCTVSASMGNASHRLTSTSPLGKLRVFAEASLNAACEKTSGKMLNNNSSTSFI